MIAQSDKCATVEVNEKNSVMKGQREKLRDNVEGTGGRIGLVETGGA